MSVKRIGCGSFGYCVALEDLCLPEGLEEMDRDAFRMVSHITYSGKLTSEENWGAKARN